MKKNEVKIEQRLNNMKKFYVNAGKFIDELPEAIPVDIRNMLKDKILGDKELKELMNGIDAHRPPRIFMIGRTGVGKSSLINAICGSYVANVDDVKCCTPITTPYQIKDGDRVLMEILDTRGIAESESLNDEQTAESQLLEQIKVFTPDVAIFMLNCTHRDDIKEDIEFLKKVTTEYAEINKMQLPVIAVINKCDEMQPGRLKNPNEYPNSKMESIKEVVQYYKGIIVNNGLKIKDIIPVSSYIEWKTEDGVEIDAKNIINLPEKDIENLKISFDGRYNIEELINILDKAILDFEAQMGLRMAFRLEELVKRLSKHLTHIFATLAGTVAITPIPLSDIYILIILQAVLVVLIAMLSGREISLEMAKEFILSAGGVGGAGFVFRLVAQQASKFANLIFPGSGSAISAGVAGFGTELIGKAAISYYIDGNDLDTIKKEIEKAKKEHQKE